MTTKNQKLHQDHNTSAARKSYHHSASHWTNKGIKKRCQSTPLSLRNQEIKQQSRIQCENRRTKSLTSWQCTTLPSYCSERITCVSGTIKCKILTTSCIRETKLHRSGQLNKRRESLWRHKMDAELR